MLIILKTSFCIVKTEKEEEEEGEEEEKHNRHPFGCKSNEMEGTSPWLDSQVVVYMFLQHPHKPHSQR